MTLSSAGRPPVWMAATTDAGIRRAARLADAWLADPTATPDELRARRELYEQERGGPPAELPAIRDVVVAPTDEEAAELGRALTDPGSGTTGALTAGLADAPGRYVVGGPETAAGQLRAVLDAGVDHVIFRVQRVGITHAQALRTLDLLAREVIPGAVGVAA
jgi:alkanesulfonate monooxygenase SsuD/methylene tetrahydromethanopterin reductase-like flavin-dependent oxidoreductase (luciferase family)